MEDSILQRYRELCIEGLRCCNNEQEMMYVVSGIPQKYYMEMREDKINLDALERMKLDKFIKDIGEGSRGGVYLEGRGYTGKSMASAYIVMKYLECKKYTIVDSIHYKTNIWWWDYQDLIEKLRRFDSIWREFIDYTFGLDLVVIDDFGRDYSKDSDFVKGETERLFKRLIENRGCVILSSNITFERLRELYSKKLMMMLEKNLVNIKFILRM